MKKVLLLFAIPLQVFLGLSSLNAQSVEIQGKLKLDPNQTTEYNNATYAVVIDTANALALKALQLIGVPATGIILSEIENNTFLLNAGFNRIGRIMLPVEGDASTLGPGSFSDMSGSNAPPAISGTNAVWTGTEMLVWDCDQNNGGRYNPALDQWEAISSVSSPSQRFLSTAIWTGTHMIVWGGTDGFTVFNSGARYDPASDTWTPMSTVNAPPKYGHSAIWTGTEMIVWGGVTSLSPFTVTNTGSKYNPTTNTWTNISSANAPSASVYHSGIWTGSDMIIHGGVNNNTTKKYNPVSNTWTTLVHSGVVRFLHTAIWTGSSMIVWGGSNSLNSPIVGLNTGGVYNAATNSWTTTSTTNAPSPRVSHSAVWTDEEMIIWGGSHEDVATNTGARYHPNTNTWVTTSLTNCPSPRASHTGIWTGSEQIIWGGGDINTTFNDGKKYNPVTSGYLPAVNTSMYLYSKN